MSGKTNMHQLSVEKGQGNVNTNDHDTTMCVLCGVAINEEDSGIKCDFCDNWHRFICCKLSDSLYKVLSEDESNNVMWFCDGCTRAFSKAKNMYRTMQMIENKIQKNDTELLSNLGPSLIKKA